MLESATIGICYFFPAVCLLFSCVCEHLGYHKMLQSLTLISDHKNHYHAPDSAV